MRRINRLDLTLCVFWLSLLVVSVLSSWWIGFSCFFAFAAGERWDSTWS